MLIKTEILNFSIGGFSQGNEKIIWQDNKLYHFFDGSFLDQDFIKDEDKNVAEYIQSYGDVSVSDFKRVSLG